jgi:hypothetical protein
MLQQQTESAMLAAWPSSRSGSDDAWELRT